MCVCVCACVCKAGRPKQFAASKGRPRAEGELQRQLANLPASTSTSQANYNRACSNTDDGGNLRSAASQCVSSEESKQRSDHEKAKVRNFELLELKTPNNSNESCLRARLRLRHVSLGSGII